MRVKSNIWCQVFERDNGFCQYCGEDLLATPVAFSCAQVDHIVPVAAGGGDDPKNLLLSCSTCNGALSRSSSVHLAKERKGIALKAKQKLTDDYKSWLSLRK